MLKASSNFETKLRFLTQFDTAKLIFKSLSFLDYLVFIECLYVHKVLQNYDILKRKSVTTRMFTGECYNSHQSHIFFCGSHENTKPL